MQLQAFGSVLRKTIIPQLNPQSRCVLVHLLTCFANCLLGGVAGDVTRGLSQEIFLGARGDARVVYQGGGHPYQTGVDVPAAAFGKEEGSAGEGCRLPPAPVQGCSVPPAPTL